MDTRYPHAIVTDEEVAAMPEEVRRHFRPLTAAKARMLVAMTPEQRGAWLRANPIDSDLVERIRREERKMARKIARLREQGKELPARGSKHESFGALVRDAIREEREQKEQGRLPAGVDPASAPESSDAAGLADREGDA